MEVVPLKLANEVAELLSIVGDGRKALPTELNDYANRLTELANQANEGTITQEEYDTGMEETITAMLLLLFLAGTGKESEDDLTEEEQAALAAAIALNLESVEGLSADIYAGEYRGDDANNLEDRLALWVSVAAGLYFMGQVMAGGTEVKLKWRFNPAKEHCSDCARLDGQVHTAEQWRASGWIPRDGRLACKGFRCGCVFDSTNEAVSGSF